MSPTRPTPHTLIFFPHHESGGWSLYRPEPTYPEQYVANSWALHLLASCRGNNFATSGSIFQWAALVALLVRRRLHYLNAHFGLYVAI